MDHDEFTCYVSRAGGDASPYVLWSPLVLFLFPIMIAIGLAAWFFSPAFFVLLAAVAWVFRGALSSAFASERRIIANVDVVVSEKGIGLLSADERLWIPVHEIAGIEMKDGRWVIRTQGGMVVGVPEMQLRTEDVRRLRRTTDIGPGGDPGRRPSPDGD